MAHLDDVVPDEARSPRDEHSPPLPGLGLGPATQPKHQASHQAEVVLLHLCKQSHSDM